MANVLELQAIRKQYGGGNAPIVEVLHGIDFSLQEGEFVALTGPSGSGKTTLLRILAGFETPDAGRIVMQGRTLFDEDNFIPAHQRGIGFVPQEGALFPHLNVADNIAWGLDGTRHEKRARVEALMEMVSLDRKLATHWPHEISGGQQQRVALARALAQRPSLMLLDEPFSALDTGLRAMTRKATADLLAEAGVASILVTHDQNEALSFATQVAVMRSGRFTQVGTPFEVYTQPVDEETALFLGDALILPARLSPGRASCVLGDLAMNHIVPIASKYEALLLDKVYKMSQIPGLNASADIELIKKIQYHTAEIQRLTAGMVDARKVANRIEDQREKAIAYHDTVAACFDEIRRHIDKLEEIVDDQMWPLPKYRELLFLR